MNEESETHALFPSQGGSQHNESHSGKGIDGTDFKVVYPNQILRLLLSPDFVNVRVLPSGFRYFLDERQKENKPSNATTELQKKYKNRVSYLNSESLLFYV